MNINRDIYSRLYTTFFVYVEKLKEPVELERVYIIETGIFLVQHLVFFSISPTFSNVYSIYLYQTGHNNNCVKYQCLQKSSYLDRNLNDRMCLLKAYFIYSIYIMLNLTKIHYATFTATCPNSSRPI